MAFEFCRAFQYDKGQGPNITKCISCCKLKQVHFLLDIFKLSCSFLSLIDYLIDT